MNPRHVAILGAGPSGSALACLLAMQGIDTSLFDDGVRPALFVGESLIPAIVPVLRRLGVEERIAAISLRKPGVSFTLNAADRVDFNFRNVSRCGLPPYAYNVPRPGFDRVLDERATELGVRRARTRAKVERIDEDNLRLSAATLAAAPWLGGRQPDLIVDATGRARMFAHVMEIPARLGPRKDVAYFAHYAGFETEEPRGQVIIGRLESGWAWRIPHREALSLGVVINKDDAAPLGATAEQRLEAIIARDPVLSAAGAKRRRISDVQTYANYQLISERGHGPGWVMIGDAYGFVDPMLSPGLHLALESARLVAENLGDLARYAAEMEEWIAAWMELIAYFYDGRMFTLYMEGSDIQRRHPGAISDFMQRKTETLVACMASGATTRGALSRGSMEFMARHLMGGRDPAALCIR